MSHLTEMHLIIFSSFVINLIFFFHQKLMLRVTLYAYTECSDIASQRKRNKYKYTSKYKYKATKQE